MAPGLMRETADVDIDLRDEFRATGQFEALALLTLDCVEAVKVLLQRGSVKLQEATAADAVEQPAVLKVA